MRYLAILLLALAPVVGSAQNATLTSPTTEAKIIVESLNVDRSGGGWVRVSFQTSANVVKRYVTFAIAQNELVSFVSAQMTSRSGETGSNPRKMNFRILGWLLDNGKLIDDDGQSIAVTLVP